MQRALDTERTIDITTTGRHSGRPHRVEIWFHNVDGDIFITGTPGRRDWYANLLAEPRLVFHLKESVTADLLARAEPIIEKGARRRTLSTITQRLGASQPLQDWVQRSPLVRIEFES